jgi:hypothetical protein
MTVKRLNQPSLNPPTTCDSGGVMPDGTPTSRHTYNHLAYIAHADRMYAFGGNDVPCGFMRDDTWTFDLASLTWRKMRPSGPIPAGTYARLVAYDPNTRKILIHDWFSLFSYSFETDTYTRLSPEQAISENMNAVIDPARKLFVMVGNGNVQAYDISPGSAYTRQTWRTTGATDIVNGQNIGLAYDSARGRIVAWNGGDTVYSLDLDTKIWTAITYPNGPGARLRNGTYGRFAYLPASGVFVIVNSVNNNAYALRLTPSDGAVPPNPPGAVAVQ